MAGWQKGKGWGWFWGKDDEIGALNAITAGFCWVLCLGTPIRDHSGRVVAAISISFPKNRVDAKALGRFHGLLLESAGELSQQLRYKEPALAGRLE